MKNRGYYIEQFYGKIKRMSIRGLPPVNKTKEISGLVIFV